MSDNREGRINVGFILFCAAVTGIGGFLFGYDTAVINGANTYLKQFFHLDAHRDAILIGLATASAIIGCIPGAMSAGFISDRFGRRKVLFFCAILYAASGILSAVPRTFVEFIIARILSGVAIGVSSMICPVYIAEIAPPKWRGRLGTLFQLGIVIGIFITLFINGKIQSLGTETWNIQSGWRWMLAAEAIPAFLFIALLFPIPESPRWLIQAGRESEARRTLDRIGGTAYADGEVAAVNEVLKEEQGTFSELFARAWRRPLIIAVFLMAASQLSGINVIMYYSTDIFKNAAGIGQVAAQVQAFKDGVKKVQEDKAPADLSAAQAGAWLLDNARSNAIASAKAIGSADLKPALDAAGVAAITAELSQALGATTMDALTNHVAAAGELSKKGAVAAKFAEIEDIANKKAFACSVWIGLVNLLATFIAILFIDKAGRKPLLLIGNAIQVVGLASVGYLYFIHSQSANMLLLFVIVYTAAFAMAMGPIPWVLCSEIFPAKLRGRAMSVSTFAIWLACYTVSQTFPSLLKTFGPTYTFWFYAACSAATFLFVIMVVPETKGRSLEEIEKSWRKHHD